VFVLPEKGFSLELVKLKKACLLVGSMEVQKN
jgi:hypothetical protein